MIGAFLPSVFPFVTRVLGVTGKSKRKKEKRGDQEKKKHSKSYHRGERLSSTSVNLNAQERFVL